MIQLQDYNFTGKKVIIRVDFNVPLDKKYKITDDTRITSALPTINYILDGGGSVILMSHLGRPKGGYEEKYSLQHLVYYVGKLLQRPVKFAKDCINDEAAAMAAALQPGEVLLLENLRFYKEEEEGNEDFAKRLASFADIYINDAFGTAHRAHASTTTIAHYFDTDHKGFGFLMNAEVANGQKLLTSAERPITAIVGGAKVSDKIKLLNNLVRRMDNILIGGGMAYTFIKAKNGAIGNSLVENDYLSMALEIIESAKNNGCQLYLPPDSMCADAFSNDAQAVQMDSNAIEDGWMGLDIGQIAINTYREVILDSATILWNGPMGVFEFEKFSDGTFSVARAVAEATKKGAFSLIGGGDSVAAINKCGLEKEVSFVSTGGGAMLEMLEGKTLPGVAAILA